MSIATNLYRSSLIADANRAELDLMRNSSQTRGLINSNADLAEVSRRESELAQQRIQKETELQLARAQQDKMKKLNRFA